MIIIYCLMILVGLVPVWLVTRYILLEEKIRKQGAVAIAEITSIQTLKAGTTNRTVLLDKVTLQYPNQFTGNLQLAQLRVRKGKYKYSERPSVRYLADIPAKVIVADSKREYWPAILLAIGTFTIMIIAVYKIEQYLNQ